MRLILAIAAVLLFTTCTKFGKNISITGFVRNPVTGQAYESAKIQLLKGDYQLPGGYKVVKTFYTNADGYFEIHHLGGTSNYQLLAFPEDNYTVGWYEDGNYVGVSSMTVEKRRYMHPIFEMVEYGRYSLVVNNVNCQGSNDTIIINQQNQVGSFLDKDWVLAGCSGYTTALQDVPMGWIYINWTVIRNGISNSFSDQVYIEEGQDVTYTLDY